MKDTNGSVGVFIRKKWTIAYKKEGPDGRGWDRTTDLVMNSPCSAWRCYLSSTLGGEDSFFLDMKDANLST